MVLKPLILSALLQFGLLSGQAIVADSSDAGWNIADFPPAYATLGVDASWGIWFFQTRVRTDMWMGTLTCWVPYDVSFSLDTGVKLGQFVVVGWKHSCYHPISVYSVVNDYQLLPNSEGSLDDFYVRITIGGK